MGIGRRCRYAEPERRGIRPDPIGRDVAKRPSNSQYGNPVSRHGALSCANSRYCQLVGSPGGSKVGSMASLALFCSARQHYCRAGSNCATRFSAKPCHGKPFSGQYLTINWPTASRKGLRSMGLSILRIAVCLAFRSRKNDPFQQFSIWTGPLISIPCDSRQASLSSSIGPKTACHDRALLKTWWHSYCQHDNNAAAPSKIGPTMPWFPPWSLQATRLIDNNGCSHRTKRRVAKPDFHIVNCWMGMQRTGHSV